MKSELLLRPQPLFHEKIWGGERMRSAYGYDIPSAHTGECWAISAHKNGDCPMLGEYRGETLGSLWKTRRGLFGGLEGENFPLLIKIIDAKEDLSVQVHPDDAYAAAHENGSLGKTECWYILDCDPGATIIIGHNCATRDELREKVEQGRWSELLREVPVKKGDFFQIDPGCVHAIKGGTMILETQQSSDVTYRFYDYGRLENGRPRPLHIEQSLAVATVPYVPRAPKRGGRRDGAALITRLVKCSYYSVYHVELGGRASLEWDEPFVNMSVISGEGEIDGLKVRAGTHLVVPAGYGALDLSGNMELICSHV